MANSDKNIVITPNIGSASSDPQIVFSGANTTLGPQNITLKAYPLNSGSLSFEGSAGQLFSITNNLTTGSIFSVNDVSGIPSIDVDANGTIELAPFNGRVGIGTTNPTSTTDIWGLQANSSATSASVPTGTLRLAFNGGQNPGNYGASLVFSQRWWNASAIQTATGQISGVKTAADGFFGGGLAFFTSNGNGNDLAERLRLDSAGNANIINGNLVIGTSGKGIDFSAHTNAAGMTNELLDDYEEGTWTPTLTNGGTLTVVEATYTKIGRLVSIYAYVNNVTPTNNTSVFVIGGLPFTNKSGSAFHCGSIGFAGGGNLNDWRPLVDVNSTSVYFHIVSGSNLRRTNANYVTLNNNGELLFNVTYNIR